MIKPESVVSSRTSLTRYRRSEVRGRISEMGEKKSGIDLYRLVEVITGVGVVKKQIFFLSHEIIIRT